MKFRKQSVVHTKQLQHMGGKLVSIQIFIFFGYIVILQLLFFRPDHIFSLEQISAFKLFLRNIQIRKMIAVQNKHDRLLKSIQCCD